VQATDLKRLQIKELGLDFDVQWWVS